MKGKEVDVGFEASWIKEGFCLPNEATSLRELGMEIARSVPPFNVSTFETRGAPLLWALESWPRWWTRMP